MIEINSISRIHGPNPPGLAMVIAILADQIISMPEYFPDGTLSEDPVIAEGSQVYAFFVSDIGGEHDQDIRRDTCQHSLEFQYATPEDDGDELARTFRGREFVLITTNLRGIRKIAGTKEHPLQLRTRKSTGGVSGFYGYRLQFSGVTLWPAPRFEGELAAGAIPVPQADPQMMDFSPFDFSNYDFY